MADPTATSPRPLLTVENLSKVYPVYSGGLINRRIGEIRAVDGISFHVRPGETLGLVGESGSGKTTTARAILRAIRPTGGSVILQSRQMGRVDLCTLSDQALKPLRTEMQMVFQDPFSSLNPRMTVEEIVGEPLLVHGIGSKQERRERVRMILEKVGLEDGHRQRYPHAFSGGQRQRIGIARALIMNPSLVVADEAVSALDVSVQAQVINLLQDLQDEFGLTYIFVAHDLAVVRHICDRVAVMYRGKIVEIEETEQLFSRPLHPYTQRLLRAIPSPNPDITLRPQTPVGGAAYGD